MAFIELSVFLFEWFAFRLHSGVRKVAAAPFSHPHIVVSAASSLTGIPALDHTFGPYIGAESAGGTIGVI